MKKIIFLLACLIIVWSCSKEDSNDENSDILGEESYTLNIIDGPLSQSMYSFNDTHLIESEFNFYDYALSSSEDWFNEMPIGFRTELNALEFSAGQEFNVIASSSNFNIRDNVNDVSYASGNLIINILRKFRPQGEEFGPNDYAYDIDLKTTMATGLGDGIIFPIEFNIRNMVIYDCSRCIEN